jgi:hypothetical protein
MVNPVEELLQVDVYHPAPSVAHILAGFEHRLLETEQLLEAVVERENMWLALKQVERNKDAAGVDKMTVGQLRAYLREHWLRIKEELLAGTYQPLPEILLHVTQSGVRCMILDVEIAPEALALRDWQRSHRCMNKSNVHMKLPL